LFSLVKKILVIMILISFQVANVSAKTILVPDFAETIQLAVDQADNGDKIELADGVFSGSGNTMVNLSGKSIEIRSANGPSHCIVDCQNQWGFYTDDGSVVFRGITIRNASSSGDGAAVQIVYSAEIQFINCKFMGNTAEDGGAVASTTYYPISFIDCIFSNNYARGDGGAINLYSNSSASFTGCQFFENSAVGDGGALSVQSLSLASFTACKFERNRSNELGGAAYCDTDRVTFDRCYFLSNDSLISGGGLHIFSPQSEINSCIFTGNISKYGGAAYSDSSTSSVFTNCMITGNIARENGGGLLFYSDTSVINSTFSLNKATNQGGASWCRENNVDFKYCIMWGDMATEGKEIYETGGASVTYSDIDGGYIGSGNIDEKPLFLSLDTTGDLYLRPDSHCINRVSISLAEIPDTDLALRPRPATEDPVGVENIVDMGAYEYQYDYFLSIGNNWHNSNDWYEKQVPGVGDSALVSSEIGLHEKAASLKKLMIIDGELAIFDFGVLSIGD
jgi:predicted outer membrane repeat protein